MRIQLNTAAIFILAYSLESQAVFHPHDPRILNLSCAQLIQQIQESRLGPGYIRTVNHKGRMEELPDELVGHLVKDIALSKQKSTKKLRVWDIGVGSLGVSTAAALKAGADSVMAMDMSEVHLRELYTRMNESMGHIDYVVGSFPRHLEFLHDDPVDFVYIGRVIHFMKPHEVKQGFSKILSMVKEGTKLYVSSATPFAPQIQTETGPDWVSTKRRPSDRGGRVRMPKLPEFENLYPPVVHVHTHASLESLLRKTNTKEESWDLEDIFYYGEPTVDPTHATNQTGRIGLVAKKAFRR